MSAARNDKNRDLVDPAKILPALVEESAAASARFVAAIAFADIVINLWSLALTKVHALAAVLVDLIAKNPARGREGHIDGIKAILKDPVGFDQWIEISFVQDQPVLTIRVHIISNHGAAAAPINNAVLFAVADNVTGKIDGSRPFNADAVPVAVNIVVQDEELAARLTAFDQDPDSSTSHGIALKLDNTATQPHGGNIVRSFDFAVLEAEKAA